MTENEVANTSHHFRGQKSHFNIEIQLKQHQKDPILAINIQNTQTNSTFLLEMDKIQITRDKILGNIFRNTQELFEELVSGFEEINIEENPSNILIKYEVKMGRFRKEAITLELKQHQQKKSQQEKVNISPTNSKKKVIIDKSYTRDFNSFKEDFNKICQKISHKEVLAKLNINNERNTRIKVKNMFIAFANTIMKSYRKNVEFADIEITQEQCFTEPANKLLTQKNELLQNIMLKAIKRIKETPTQQLDIDFMPEIPTQLLVMQEDGQQIPLQNYLTPLPKEQIESRIRYHQKRRERMMNSFNLINHLKKQKTEEMARILQRSESERRNSRLSFSNKGNATDTNDYDEF